MDSIFFTLNSKVHPATLMLKGDWTIKRAGELTRDLLALKHELPQQVHIIASQLQAIDTAGAWILIDWVDNCKQKLDLNINEFSPTHILIFKRVKDAGKLTIPPKPAKKNVLTRFVENLGKATLTTANQMYILCGFLGKASITFIRSMFHPKTWRFPELARHIEETGFNAIPIIAMMGFLISVVIAYQGSFQLRKFGAEIYTIDLVAISVLREMGVLVTAIMVAGRSGSAFAAEIGVMKVNEEIDALRTLGLSPITILVLPRMIALIITLPLLTFLADMMGLLGAALLLMSSIGISFEQFAERVQQAIVFSTFGTGMLKAPVFAAVIALVGCLRGMQVTNSAESVGEMTTKAVVEAIVLVILLDAFFSILFTQLDI